VRDAQMATLSRAYDIQKQALDLRHEQEIAAQKQEWRDLSTTRKKLWDEWREEFGVRDRRRRVGQGGRGSQDGAGAAQAPSPARPSDRFADAVKLAPGDRAIEP